MRKYLAILIVLTSCSVYHKCYNARGFNAHGLAYKQAFETAIAGECRDLTDEEIDNADNMPGSGYMDGKNTGKESPNYMCIQHVFDDENGTIVIIEDDGEVVIIELDEVV